MDTNKAWYLGCHRDQVAGRVILVGDPGRVPRLSKYLEDVELLPVNRGLVMATGVYKGVGITLAAFGMGAPIAAIVLHELAALGSSVFLRIGTSIGLPPINIGDVVIARDAISYEGTSMAYAPEGGRCESHYDVVESLEKSSINRSFSYHVGTFASYDGFYKDMFALDKESESRVVANLDSLSERGVLAIDMETSALLTVGQSLGCKVGSFCVSSVNSVTKHRLSLEEQTKSEKILMDTALQALIDVELV